MTKSRTEILEEAQIEFEESEFYFCGETPGERIVYWHIWVRAWFAALGFKDEFK